MKFLVLMATLFSPLVWAEITIYRWVDERNIIHFSQHQPSVPYFEELTIKEYQKNKRVSPLELKSTEITPAEELDEKTRLRCNNSRSKLNTLLNFDKIQVTNEQGETNILTAKEKNEQVALARKEIEIYCRVSPDAVQTN